MPKLQWHEDPKALRKKRKQLGLTQQRLAKRSGVDRTIIANIEAGRRRLTGKVADLLWNALTRASFERRSELLPPEELANLVAIDRLSGLQWEPFGKVADAYVDAFAPYLGTVSRLEAIQLISQKEAERNRQIAALENARTIDDPIVSEVIESFRREVAGLKAYIKELEAAEPARQPTEL